MTWSTSCRTQYLNYCENPGCCSFLSVYIGPKKHSSLVYGLHGVCFANDPIAYVPKMCLVSEILDMENENRKV